MTARLDHDWLDRFEKFSGGEPVARKLALLIRPAFVAPAGKVFVWCDWSQIEARMLPWLAESRGAEAKLDVFRENDKDPSRPDVYKVSAGELLGKDPRDVTDLERQSHGKVPELSLGYGGGMGALLNMAANYRVYLSHDLAKNMIANWREKNSWAPRFWGKFTSNERYGLWGAACSAVENPGDVFSAGRVGFYYDRDYMRGTLFMLLPSGKKLAYPRIKWADVDVKDKKTGDVLYTRKTLVFRKQYGYSSLWHGKLAENATQAECATILRRTLVELEYGEGPYGDRLYDWMPVVGHTHDEIVTEADEGAAEEASRLLHELMTRGFDWSPGLPLAAEATTNWYYTKAKVE